MQKMQCSDVRQILLLLDDRETSHLNGESRSKDALQHASDCVQCGKFLVEVREVSRMVRSVCSTEAPLNFISGLHEKLSAVPVLERRSFSFPPAWKYAVAASFLFAALMSGMFLSQNGAKKFYVSQKWDSWNSVFAGHLHFYTAFVLPDINAPNIMPNVTKTVFRTPNPDSLTQNITRRRVLPERKMAAIKKIEQPPHTQEFFGQMVKIQIQSEKAMENVALLLESNDDVSFEGENRDGKTILWQGSVPENKSVAILVPVKVHGKKKGEVKATVVTSSEEMFTDSVFIGGKKDVKDTNLLTPSYSSGKSIAQIPGKCLIFVPQTSSISSAQTKNIPLSGITVSMQEGYLALSDVTLERIAYVPNPKGELQLVLADTKVDLTDVQVTSHE